MKLVSQLTNICSLLDIPHDFIKSTQTLIDEFVIEIKREGRHWISMETLYTHPRQGGIGIIVYHLLQILMDEKILKLPGISSLFKAYRQLKIHLPTNSASLGNTWLTQTVFLNPNPTRSIPNCKKHLTFKITRFLCRD